MRSSKYSQVDYGISYDGYQDILFPKTPLDKALEAVDAKYDSITKAPPSVVRQVRRVARGMGLPVKMKRKKCLNTPTYKYVNTSDMRKEATPVPHWFRFWYNANGRACTNYKPLVKSVKYARHDISPKAACRMGNFPLGRFKALHLRTKGYMWNYGKIHQRVGSIRALIRYCRALNWRAGPLSYTDWTFHSYKGTVVPFNYIKPVLYRKDK